MYDENYLKYIIIIATIYNNFAYLLDVSIFLLLLDVSIFLLIMNSTNFSGDYY